MAANASNEDQRTGNYIVVAGQPNLRVQAEKLINRLLDAGLPVKKTVESQPAQSRHAIGYVIFVAGDSARIEEEEITWIETIKKLHAEKPIIVVYYDHGNEESMSPMKLLPDTHKAYDLDQVVERCSVFYREWKVSTGEQEPPPLPEDRMISQKVVTGEAEPPPLPEDRIISQVLCYASILENFSVHFGLASAFGIGILVYYSECSCKCLCQLIQRIADECPCQLVQRIAAECPDLSSQRIADEIVQMLNAASWTDYCYDMRKQMLPYLCMFPQFS